jgi:hypothetical protein
LIFFDVVHLAYNIASDAFMGTSLATVATPLMTKWQPPVVVVALGITEKVGKWRQEHKH